MDKTRMTQGHGEGEHGARVLKASNRQAKERKEAGGSANLSLQNGGQGDACEQARTAPAEVLSQTEKGKRVAGGSILILT